MINENISKTVQSDDLKKTDLFMMRLILAHWFIATFLTSYAFNTYLLGTIIGGVITLVTYTTYKLYAGTSFYRIIVAISIMSFSILFIQQFYGRIELHFHIFVGLAFLTAYRDRLPLAIGSIFILLHHLIFNYLQYYGISILGEQIVVFNYGCGLDIVFLHAIFVLAEWFVLDQNIKRKISEFNLLLKSKNELFESNHELRRIFDNAQVGLMYINQDRILVKANKHLANIFGYDSEEKMVGISMRAFHISQERYESYGKKNFNSLKMGVRNNIEYQLRKKDGSIIWCELSGKTIDDNIPADMSKGVLWVIKDITAQKQKNEEFELIFDYSKDGIAIIDLESKFLKLNKALCEIVEYDEKDLLNRSCLDLTIEEDIKKTEDAIQTVIKTGSILNLEKGCYKKDGSVIILNMSATLLPEKNSILIVAKDISNLKKMEEQSKNASMGEMIGNIAHQWRQPLSAISSSATGMKLQREYGLLDDKQFIESCDFINDNAQYLSKTIDDFRNFIRGNDILYKFNLKELINKFLSLAYEYSSKEGLEVFVYVDDGIEIESYPNELIQCFMNILNNSKDAFQNTHIDKKYFIIEAKVKEENIVISLKDNAGGINENILPKIYEPYFTTKHKSKGTGLGLHMTYNLVTKGMNGYIEAHNVKYDFKDKDCVGVELKITIPLKL